MLLDSKDVKGNPMLASIMIHEFKNPMSLIQAEVEYIALGDKDNKYNKNFKVIHREMERANEMVTKWISTLDSPQQVKEGICVYHEIMECADYFLPTLNKSIQFNMNCEDQTLQVLGSQKFFGIAISNIIKNSIEAIEKEGVIEATVRKEDDQVVMIIKDTGAGLTDEVMARIEAGESYTSKPHGSGLGVNISKKYAQDNKGTYRIEQGEQGGCIVTMTFPVL